MVVMMMIVMVVDYVNHDKMVSTPGATHIACIVLYSTTIQYVRRVHFVFLMD